MTLPVTLIGGYLGAGKTTLVNHALRHAGGLRIAVLVNEFGALPIDEDLIEAQDGALISIAGGCICCAFGDDLLAALDQMATLDPRPDHVLIETSGVAIPATIGQSVTLLETVTLSGIVVLADALNLQGQLRDEYIGDTVARQLSDADLIVLTKADLATGDMTDQAKITLKEHSAAPVVQTMMGQVPNTVLLDSFAPELTGQRVPHHDALYDSFVLQSDSPLDSASFARKLADPSLGLLRAKGQIMGKSGHMLLVQAVGTRVQITDPAEPKEPSLVFIGLKGRLDQAAIEAALETSLC